MLVNDKSTWQKKGHPTETGVTFTLRYLTDDEYQEALDARFDQVIDKAKNMGAELSRSLQDRASNQPANPLQALHAATAIKYAVQAWSYEVECNDENKLALDKATQDWLKEEIVGMNGPRPLQTPQPSDGESSKEQSPVNSPVLTSSGAQA